MATRSIIKIKGQKLAIYKHWDGNPTATLPFLISFTKDFIKNRGKDKEYFTAQLLRHSVKKADEFNLDNDDYTGWGLIDIANPKCGQEFTYLIDLENEKIKINSKFININNDIEVQKFLKD